MRRSKSIYIVIPLIFLVFLAGIQPAHAIDWGDIFGGGAGAGIVGGICAVTGAATLGVSCALAAAVGGIIGLFGGFDWIGDAFGGLVAGLVRAVVAIVNVVIVSIATILFWIANGLVMGALELNTTIQDSTVVKEGFNIVLDVANLGLVVAIIIGAFMVMLRRPQANKVLIRFIAAALVINFSFFIVTNLLIKPVNEVTEVLIEAANFDFNTFATVFAPGGFNFPTLFEGFLGDPPAAVGTTGAKAIASVPGWGVEILISLLSVLFLFSFVAIGIFVLLAFAAMFFVRYIALGFLVIIMPLAWIAWIFPGLKIPGGNPANLWWEQFSRWLLFAPIGMFFFFLAIKAVTAQDVLDLTTADSSTLAGSFEQFGSAVGNMILIVGFLLGGLIVANKMSITGSKYAMTLGKKGGKYIRGKTWEKTKIAGTYFARRAGPEFDAEGERVRRPTLTERAQRAGRDRGLVGKTLTMPARTVGNLMANARIAGEKAYKDAKGRVDKLSIDEMEKRYDSEGGAGQLAILTNIFAEIRKLNEKESKGKEKDPTFTLEENDQGRLNRLNAILGTIPNARERMERLRLLYAQDELRVGKKAEELFEAAKEEGRAEAGTPPAPPPPPVAPPTP